LGLLIIDILAKRKNFHLSHETKNFNSCRRSLKVETSRQKLVLKDYLWNQDSFLLNEIPATKGKDKDREKK